MSKVFILLDAKGLSRKELCNFLGISQQQLTDWKSGRVKSYKKHIDKIAEFLDVSVDYLLGRSTEIKKTAEPDEKAQQLLDIFYSFSNEGKDKLLEQAKMMQSFGAYNADSNVVKIAARSGNPDDVKIVDIDTLPDAPNTI